MGGCLVAALPIIAWLVLAVIGAVAGGIWGFLGVGFLFVAWYAFLRRAPNVHVHMTRNEYLELHGVEPPPSFGSERALPPPKPKKRKKKKEPEMRILTHQEALAEIEGEDDAERDDQPEGGAEIVRLKKCRSCRTKNRGDAYKCSKCGAIFSPPA
jgi:predicted RNA-binding Zn-ribbon protein involved in translation (DUF1610 family)